MHVTNEARTPELFFLFLFLWGCRGVVAKEVQGKR